MKDLIVMLPFLLLISCSPKPEVTSTKISFGAAASAAGTTFLLAAKGSMVTESNSSGTNETRFKPDLIIKKLVPISGSLSFEVENGDWIFGAIQWDGEGFTGNVKCTFDESSRKLEGDDVNITLTLSPAGCSTDMSPFTKTEYADTNGSLSGIKFVSCLMNEEKNADNTPASETCASNPGLYKSFKVSLYPFTASGPGRGTPWDNRGAAIESKCVDITAASNYASAAISGGELKIPLYEDMPTTVEAYYGTGCSGSPDSFNFHEGLRREPLLASQHGFIANEKDGGGHVPLLLTSPNCNPLDNTGNDGFPSDSSPEKIVTICSESEVSNIAGGTTKKYVLANDLDLTNYNSSPSITGSLIIDGNKKTISNLTVPLFSTITTSATLEKIKINNINFLNANVNGNGILANHIDNSSGVVLDEFKIHDIFFDGTTALSSASNDTGLLIGKIDNNSTKSFELQNISNSGTIAIDGTSKVGGLVGSAKKTELRNIVLNSLTINASGFDAGGLIGHSYNSDTRMIHLSNLSVNSSGQYGTGGLIGTSYEGNIYDNIQISGTLENTHASPGKVGGMIGVVQNTTAEPHYIMNSNINLAMNFQNATTLHKDYSAGGMIGYSLNYYNTSNSINLGTISNSKINITVSAPAYTDSTFPFGGVIGTVDSSAKVNIKRVVLENIDIVTDNAPSPTYTGSILGYGFTSSSSIIDEVLVMNSKLNGSLLLSYATATPFTDQVEEDNTKTPCTSSYGWANTWGDLSNPGGACSDGIPLVSGTFNEPFLISNSSDWAKINSSGSEGLTHIKTYEIINDIQNPAKIGTGTTFTGMILNPDGKKFLNLTDSLIKDAGYFDLSLGLRLPAILGNEDAPLLINGISGDHPTITSYGTIADTVHDAYITARVSNAIIQGGTSGPNVSGGLVGSLVDGGKLTIKNSSFEGNIEHCGGNSCKSEYAAGLLGVVHAATNATTLNIKNSHVRSEKIESYSGADSYSAGLFNATGSFLEGKIEGNYSVVNNFQYEGTGGEGNLIASYNTGAASLILQNNIAYFGSGSSVINNAPPPGNEAYRITSYTGDPPTAGDLLYEFNRTPDLYDYFKVDYSDGVNDEHRLKNNWE